MPEVYVVLSTYNGEEYLAEQLESILTQQSVQTQLLIRDDGSTDNSREILSRYARQYDNITVNYESNIGVINSFMRLLLSVPVHARYIAFADQDDIWKSDKLIRAVNKINAVNVPVMYCSIYDAINEQGELLWQSSTPPRAISFNNALIENICTGCTVVINKQLLDCLQISHLNTDKLVMHDWWVYLVASCFGQVIFDDYASICYRQHAGNVVGVKNGFAFWWGRLQRFILKSNNNSRLDQAREFARVFAIQLSDTQTLVLQNFTGYKQLPLLPRLCYSLRTPIYMQKKVDNLILKLQMLIRRVN